MEDKFVYEKPELKSFGATEGKGLGGCETGSGDSMSCQNGNSPANVCNTGSGV